MRSLITRVAWIGLNADTVQIKLYLEGLGSQSPMASELDCHHTDVRASKSIVTAVSCSAGASLPSVTHLQIKEAKQAIFCLVAFERVDNDLLQ